VFKDGSTYKLWYTSTPDDTTNFRVGYAESSNGFVWNKITYNALSLSSPTWGAGSQAHPFVLKVGSEYKMWFSSTDGGNWQIGLATSPDGITWTPYAGNPIITKTQIWEHNDFGGSSVIFDGTTYHMWYSTNSPFSINYARSNLLIDACLRLPFAYVACAYVAIIAIACVLAHVNNLAVFVYFLCAALWTAFIITYALSYLD